ncbi:MAG TPA: amidohydrolase family protein [Novosphingobium sp.]|nr:amidohydrolase family protein [Novosphingobium sp.]
MDGLIETPWPRDRVMPPLSWQRPAGLRVISSDDHLIEPVGLWQDRLKGADRDRAPRYWRDETGFHLEVDGQSYDVPGLPPEFPEGREGFWDVDKRLADMDAEGIDAALIYHGRLNSLIRMPDKAFWLRCVDVCNEWAAEWRAAAPARLFPVALLPTFFTPEATGDYLQKLKALGYKAIDIPVSPKGVRYNSRAMDPMWKAIEDSGLPLSFHIGAYLQYSGRGSLGANLNANLMPFTGLFGQLVFSGVFDRFPALRVVFTEGGASWVAGTLENADKVARDYASQLRPKLAHKPSWYWFNHCYTTFMEDDVAMEQIDRIGADRVMWSTDYPHPEGVMGHSDAIFRRIHDQLGEAKARRILGANAAQVWGI